MKTGHVGSSPRRHVVLVLVVIVLAAVAWLVVEAMHAADRLNAVRDDISRVRADLLNGRDPTTDLATTQRDAKAAHADTHDPLWSVVSWLPPVHTARGITDAVNDLATNALPQVVDVGTTIEPAQLRIAPNRIALAPLQAAAGPLSQAAAALARARDEVAGLPDGWGRLDTARRKVLTQLTSLSGSIDDAARFARVGPAMLGADGSRRYFVAIQNNAEARATGGLVAAYAIVTTDHGAVTVRQQGHDSALRNALTPATAMPTDYDDLYAGYRPTQTWITSNLSPNFPSAARIWAGLWQAQSGEHIDGVFGVDPFALQAMLGATGPVTVPNVSSPLTGSNLAAYIESGEYLDFHGPDQTARKAVVSDVADAVLHQLLSGEGSSQAIVSALGTAAGQHHLALWSANPNEESALTGTPLADELPMTTAPFASVSVNSATGTKLDYYLDRSLTYRATTCSGTTREATISVTLTNAAPATGLPAYVRRRGDRHGGVREVVEQVPRNELLVAIDATQGAALEAATLDGQPTAVSSGVENGHPVYSVSVPLDPGIPRTFAVRVQEPVGSGGAQSLIQPMARAQHTELDAPIC